MPNQSYQIEFSIGSSPSILFKFITNPSCLAQWFADEVQVEDHRYNFIWNGHAEEAELSEMEENKKATFSWLNSDDDEYVSFEIAKSEVTGDTILIITDFADQDEIEDQKLLWENQVTILKRLVGVT